MEKILCGTTRGRKSAVGSLLKVVTEGEGEMMDAEEEKEYVISKMVDSKPNESLTQEERFDQQMREKGALKIVRWSRERGGMGSDVWRQKIKEGPVDMKMALFADDSQNRVTARSRQELERRMRRGLDRVFTGMKASRLKVNADKTTYMVMAGPGRRRNEDMESKIYVQGEEIQAVKTGKCLGLLINNNLTWSDQTKEVTSSCRNRMNALYRVTELLSVKERQIKAESVIMSKLMYCLESTCTGRKKDLEALQGVQSQAARWVLGKGRLGWSLTAGLKQLSWLSIVQLVCYKSVQTALNVLQNKEPENLYERLTKLKPVKRKRNAREEEISIQEERVVIERSWEELSKLKASTRRAWSVISLRWLERIPSSIKELDVKGEASKKELKLWVRRHIHVRGDRIIWGWPLQRDLDPSTREDEDRDLDSDEGEAAETARGLQERVGGPNQEEAADELRRVEVEEGAVQGNGVVTRAGEPLPPLGPVFSTAPRQGEVERLSHQQDPTGDAGGISKQRLVTNSFPCMSDRRSRRLRWTGLESRTKPKNTASVKTEDVDEIGDVEVACQSLPPLGPVVWSAHTKGEEEGQLQEQAITGDKSYKNQEINTYFCMNWVKLCQKLGRKCKTRPQAAKTRKSSAKRRRESLCITDTLVNMKEMDRRDELVTESRPKTGIG